MLIISSKKNLKKKKRLFWLATFLFPHSLDLKNPVIMKSKRKKNNQTKQKKTETKQTNKQTKNWISIRFFTVHCRSWEQKRDF